MPVLTSARYARQSSALWYHSNIELSVFEKSEWFKRGWTLQELLAPQTVVFVTGKWHVIGHKGSFAHSDGRVIIGPSLETAIARITGISEKVLHSYEASTGLTVYDKLKWMEGRTTTRPEDMSYSLFGILGITLPAIYGEKYAKARQRLMAAVHRDNLALQHAENFRKITDWLSSPDPWTNHDSARQRHEPETGAWLLEHVQYLAWKSGSVRLLWIYGKAHVGCM
jgi:ankyrin repeat domain-containing protein 50